MFPHINSIIDALFTYKPEKKYNFTLPDATDQENYNNELNYNTTSKESDNKKLYTSIDVNLEYLKVKYNTLINSDVNLREFTLIARDKEYKAFLLYIDGMIDSKEINDFILKPLMLRNNANTYKNEKSVAIASNISVRKVKKFALEDYIYNCLIPQNSIKKEFEFSTVISDVNNGNCALFIDTLPIAFSIEVKGFKSRSVSEPHNEVVVRGSQEAFVEAIRINTSLIRRIINNENLIIENCYVGNITRTKIAICYMKNIANDELISEVKYRINNLGIDSLVSSRST